jgi:hypothetical protein
MKIELKTAAQFLGYLLLYSIICMLFAVFLGWLEMQYFLASKGQNYSNEFVGLYVVLALYFYGPVSCLIASPVHLLVYLKKTGNSRHWYSLAASLAVSALVAGFFSILANK